MPSLVHTRSYPHIFHVKRFAGAIAGVAACGARPTREPAPMRVTRQVASQAYLIADTQVLNPLADPLIVTQQWVFGDLVGTK